MATKVKNVVSGIYKSNPPMGFFSWLEWWEYKLSTKASDCACLNCAEKTNLTAVHVKVVGDEENVYLVPLCHECAANCGIFTVMTSKLVRIDKKYL
jgi:hypothetical protein